MQKGKVDLEAALFALDKLMMANELNFALLTVIPASIFAFYILKSIKSLFHPIYSHQVRQCLAAGREIERLCNLADSSDAHRGLLLISLYKLHKVYEHHPSAQYICEDLLDLADPDMTDDQRRWTALRLVSFLANQYYI